MTGGDSLIIGTSRTCCPRRSISMSSRRMNVSVTVGNRERRTAIDIITIVSKLAATRGKDIAVCRACNVYLPRGLHAETHNLCSDNPAYSGDSIGAVDHFPGNSADFNGCARSTVSLNNEPEAGGGTRIAAIDQCRRPNAVHLLSCGR